jgi:rhodanese-related sulfurtransferase
MKIALRQAAFLIVIALVLGLVVNSFHPRKVRILLQRPSLHAADDSLLTTANPLPGAVPIAKDDLKRLLTTNVVLIDARSTAEFAVEHLPGAMNIPFEDLGEYIDIVEALPKDKWLITYCEGPPCEKAEHLAQELFSMGFPRVGFYFDGMNDWKKSESTER